MAGYWESVPKGGWTITDPIDAINAISDPEGYVEYDSVHNRINVLGPEGKAVIIDIAKIKQSGSVVEVDKLMKLLEEFDLYI